MQEKRNKEEALRLEKAEADRAEASTKKKLAEAETATAANQQAEEAACCQAALLVTPLNSMPPLPEFTGQIGGAGGENLVEEREGGEPSTPGANVPPPPPPPSEGV